ncbi:hypothetical protein [Paenibacillus sp. 1P03SA]|uniref:hypothetical protein n=1 Tax=Paenibacillus sp. 1P03SA TaxID=3132294 RepID=UPI00399FE9F9
MNTKFVIIFISLLFFSACGSKTFLATDLIKDEIYRINIRDGGNGVLYSTSDKTIINKLWSQLSSVSYVSGSSAEISGGSTLRIFDKNNQEIGNLIHYDTVYLRVNDKEYKAVKSIDLKNVYDALIAEQNKVNE